MDSKHIISKFGGTRPLAKLLGCPASTVQNWIDRENIPSTRLQDIIKVGIAERVELSLHDFFPVQLPTKNKKSVNGNK